jgi:hypothetical protein
VCCSAAPSHMPKDPPPSESQPCTCTLISSPSTYFPQPLVIALSSACWRYVGPHAPLCHHRYPWRHHCCPLCEPNGPTQMPGLGTARRTPHPAPRPLESTSRRPPAAHLGCPVDLVEGLHVPLHQLVLLPHHLEVAQHRPAARGPPPCWVAAATGQQRHNMAVPVTHISADSHSVHVHCCCIPDNLPQPCS